MKPVAFEYCRPDTLGEALDVLSERREEAAVLAGGMTLGPMLNLRMVRPKTVIDISRLAGLDRIELRGDRLVTGATVIQADALDSGVARRELPLLALALPWVGHFQTRNAGTLGGSVAHADPSAEIPLCLVVSDATVVLCGKRRERRVAARAFFTGALSTVRQPDEMIVAIEWPRTPPEAGCAFEEIAQRHGDFAIAAAGCELRLDGAGRIAGLSLGLGGVEDRPIAVDTASFVGRLADAAAAKAIALHAAQSVDPMDDRGASADYRRALSQVLAERVVVRAAEAARQKRVGVR
ncbi:MAG TPA: FAD binding domain-containing protein [Xanthobacteraceae bacterium]|jgi:CO/xanthine dehydrogenase FAD-binding subunit|nr:FAD binding domain-containing protein [Xanthobacteraceae bacterium]